MFGERSRRPAAIIDLNLYRRLRETPSRPVIFHVGERTQCQEILECQGNFEWHQIDSVETLFSFLAVKKPDLLFIESDLRWTCPYQVIEHLTSKTKAPVVLTVNEHDRTKTREILRQAFAAGITDIIYEPMRSDEVVEMVGTLLRLHTSLSVVS